MISTAISVVVDYMDDCLFMPSHNWPEYHIQERSYSRWAAKELIRRFTISNDDPPLVIIEKLISDLDEYSETSINSEFQMIFTMGREAIKEISYLFV